MKSFYLFVCVLLISGFLNDAVAQNISNEGREFWTVFPTHDASSTLAVMDVNITSKSNSVVTVSCGSYSETKEIPANRVITFFVPRENSYINDFNSNDVLTNRGIHIVVPDDKPKVVAYSHVYAGNRSAATLILPYDALGQQYFSMNYTQDPSNNTVSKNFLVVVAADDDTDIILRKNDNSIVNINLKFKGDVYQYMPLSREDLTGTTLEINKLTSPCKRFAAFSGSTSLSIGCNRSRDPLLQQLYTVNSWGKTYGIVPFINRRYIIRVLAQENNTAVMLNGRSVGVLNKGKYLEQVLTEPAIVSANKLISVAEYSFTQNCSSTFGDPLLTGDPEMVLLNPIEFNIKNITVFSSDKNMISERYINVFMKTDKTSTFKINGQPPTNSSWQPMPSDRSYSFIQIQVFEESLHLTADDGFNAIAYGFGATESYAYSAGTNLASSSSISYVNKETGSDGTTACVGQATDFKITVPYQLTKITWTFNDNSIFSYNFTAPTEIGLAVDGSNLYTYTSPVNHTFNSVGLEIIKAIAVIVPSGTSTSASCFDGSDLEFIFDVDVLALPIPSFTVSSTEICLGSEIKPIDNSTSSGTLISKWRWQFDDEPFVEVKDPMHIFTSIGTHNIKLWVANEGGCWSNVPKEIQINIGENRIQPNIQFNALAPVCILDGKKIILANEVTNMAGTPKFTGLGIVNQTTGEFDPVIAGVGVHEITYTFTSNTGCENTKKQKIEVYATTKINTIPTVYVLAGGQKKIPAIIENVNPIYIYKYKWSPSTGLNKDDILDPIASPDNDTEYTLTVSIDGMCSVTRKVLVKVLGEIKPPNAFSPNGDGINDKWDIKSIDSYPNTVVEIFNRNGQKVFSSVGYAVPFDGTYRNEPLPIGVYYYIINPKNGRKAITGSLTLIK